MSGARGRRIFFWCPDSQVNLGGTRVFYRHVDILHRAGYDASALHTDPGFRYDWFTNDTPVACAGSIKWKSSDILVVPEIYAMKLRKRHPIPAKVIYNQNCYLTFESQFTIHPRFTYTPYRDETEFLATVCVSKDSVDYLKFVFPRHRILRFTPSIDPKVFFPGHTKKAQIAFMPRKNPLDVFQVLNLLKHRGKLDGYELRPIDRKTENEVAAILRESAFFLSFGYPEGLGLPPLEAMACGATVIGYHGRGGKEYFRPEFSFPVEMGEVVKFARAVEHAIDLRKNNPEELRRRELAATSYVRDRFSREREEREVLSLWAELRGERAETRPSIKNRRGSIGRGFPTESFPQ